MTTRRNNFIVQDVSIIVLSVFVAIIIARTGVMYDILNSIEGFQILGSFIAGIFFTSIFTTAPAIVTLGEMARTGSLISTAIFGALGAVIGDILIFKFIKDRLADHFLELIQHKGTWRRFVHLLRLKYFRWFTFFIGGLIIASPFPDELGISLMGFSKMRSSLFAIISFIFNFVGILIIGAVALSL